MDIEGTLRAKQAEATKDAMLKEEVEPEDVAMVVSRWTGVLLHMLHSMTPTPYMPSLPSSARQRLPNSEL